MKKQPVYFDNLSTFDRLELLEQAINSSSTCIAIADARKDDMPLIFVNSAFEKLTGYKLEEIVGRNCRFLQGPKSDKAVVKQMREALQERKNFHGTILNYRKNGTTFWNDLTMSPVFGKKNELNYFVSVQTDATARIESDLRINKLAFYDTLTSLPNRAHFRKHYSDYLKTAKANKSTFNLLFLDIDKFKDINDTHGHKAGDKVLKLAAQRLKRSFRKTDFLARISGDEFIAILPGQSKEASHFVCDKIHENFSHPFNIAPNTKITSSVSVGCASFPSDSTTLDGLLHAADTDMYKAKKKAGSSFKKSKKFQI